MTPALINNPLFRGITPEKLSANLEEISFHTRSYKKGEILARQGDVCNRLMILTKGSVRGEMIDYSGRLIKVEDIAAPRALAPLFLFGEENRFPVEVTANELTEVIEIPKSSVLELFRKNEQFLENYMNLSANYARTLSDKLFFMSFKTIRQNINGKTNCSLFSKHFAQDFVLLTQNKMYILLFPIICFSDFVLSLLLLS